MPYDEGLAERLRDTLAGEAYEEKKMFGGLCFMVRGHMCVGVSGDELMVRVGPEAYAEALEQSFARKMDFTGRPLRGFVFVAPEGIAEDSTLAAWVERGGRFVRSLPAK